MSCQNYYVTWANLASSDHVPAEKIAFPTEKIDVPAMTDTFVPQILMNKQAETSLPSSLNKPSIVATPPTSFHYQISIIVM
jgi:hypothetical protein